MVTSLNENKPTVLKRFHRHCVTSRYHKNHVYAACGFAWIIWSYHSIIFVPDTPSNCTSQVITVYKRSCGKVMFSQACVKNSVHGGRCTPPGQTGRHPLGSPPGKNPLGQTPPWADTSHLDRHLPLGRHPLRQTPPTGRHPHRQTPSQVDTPLHQMATGADGRHPTGMHSCFFVIKEKYLTLWYSIYQKCTVFC